MLKLYLIIFMLLNSTYKSFNSSGIISLELLHDTGISLWTIRVCMTLVTRSLSSTVEVNAFDEE